MFLVLDQMMIALFAFDSPPALPAAVRASNRIGISRLVFGVSDVDEAARRIVAHGGNVLEHTRTPGPQAILLAFADPDGTPLELVQRTG